MNFADVFYIVKRVLISPYVIGIGIAVILYLNLVSFVAHYRRQDVELPQIKRKKKPSQAADSSKPQPESDDEE